MEISSADREYVRNLFCEAADFLRKRYNMTVPQVRRSLKEIFATAI